MKLRFRPMLIYCHRCLDHSMRQPMSIIVSTRYYIKSTGNSFISISFIYLHIPTRSAVFSLIKTSHLETISLSPITFNSNQPLQMDFFSMNATEVARLSLSMDDCLQWSCNGACLYQGLTFLIGFFLEIIIVLSAVLVFFTLLNIFIITLVLLPPFFLIMELLHFLFHYSHLHAWKVALILIAFRLVFALLAFGVEVGLERYVRLEKRTMLGSRIMSVCNFLSGLCVFGSLLDFTRDYTPLGDWNWYSATAAVGVTAVLVWISKRDEGEKRNPGV